MLSLQERPALASSQASPCSAPWGPVGDGGSAGKRLRVPFRCGQDLAPGGRDGGAQDPLGSGGSSPAEPSASTDLPAGGPHAPSKAHPKGRPAGLLIRRPALLLAGRPAWKIPQQLVGAGAQAGGGDAGRASRSGCCVLGPSARFPPASGPEQSPGVRVSGVGSRRKTLPSGPPSLQAPSSVPHFISRQGLNLQVG